MVYQLLNIHLPTYIKVLTYITNQQNRHHFHYNLTQAITKHKVCDFTEGNDPGMSNNKRLGHYQVMTQVRSGQVRVFNVHIQSKLL